MFRVQQLKNRLPKYLKWFVFSLLVFTLFLLGFQESFLYRGLSDTWLVFSSFLDMPESIRNFTTHSYPYRLICVALCTCLVHFYFNEWSKTKLVLAFYGSAFLLCVMLVWISKGSGQEESIAYEIAKALIGAVVSPFLAVIFIPTLYLVNKSRNA